MTYQLHLGDCLSFMQTLDVNSVDAVVTDPPAGISFMGKAWDSDKGGRDKWIAWMSEIAAECLRVLKPGGYALAWSLPRTSHWTGMAWENGGFEPRDRIAHCFSTGFPKSLDVSKAIDKAAGKYRVVMGPGQYANRGRVNGNNQCSVGGSADTVITAAATPAAREWAGWGTALKPSIEDWWVFRKPLSDATVAANVLRWGTGALNIDASRVGMSKDVPASPGASKFFGIPSNGWDNDGMNKNVGRWPANLITDGSAEVVAMFPQRDGGNFPNGAKRTSPHTDNCYCKYGGNEQPARKMGDTGSASRFFAVCPLDENDYPPLYYAAKASRRERDEGCNDIEFSDIHTAVSYSRQRCKKCGKWYPAPMRLERRPNSTCICENPEWEVLGSSPSRNHHPTVKPLSLMRYLITLCTREGATVLDPFLGSGTTGVAAVQLGRNFIGVELDADYFKIAEARIAAAARQEPLVMTQ